MADKRKTIYVIMTCGKLEIDNTGFPNLGDTHIVGWYEDKNLAILAVQANTCDYIDEDCYPYAIIEEVKEGLYQPATPSQRWFFKYIQEKDCYEKIPEPSGFNHTCGFTIG